MGPDQVWPGGDFAFTLSEIEPQMSSSDRSGCSQTPLAAYREQIVEGRGKETREEAAAMVQVGGDSRWAHGVRSSQLFCGP